ncbi:MAG: ABC transporter ATP-binding protein [Actinomycetes bacterium]|jgi:general nucleoside transport system ATP-binding protein
MRFAGHSKYQEALNSQEGLSTLCLEAIQITKAFPGVVANDRIDIEVRSGEVLCLLGENGAGKSTLISILSGMQQPDSGTIKINGKISEINSPRIAKDLGIGVVYQHSTLISTLTVLENLMLGDTGKVLLDVKGAKEKLLTLASLLGGAIDPNTLAGDLALGQQQQVEIAKAMWGGSNILILDEPTSMLTPQAVQDLQASLESLKREGLAVIFITHKLHEAFALGDAVTVLRAGRKVLHLSTRQIGELSESQTREIILKSMFGSDSSAESNSVEVLTEMDTGSENVSHHKQRDLADSKIILELKGVSSTSQYNEVEVTDVTLSIRRGEVYGIAGIDGHGQRSLAEAIVGQRSISRGQLFFEGLDVSKMNVRQRQSLGFRYVTDDRLHEGIVGSLSVALNLFIKRIGQRPYWRMGQINWSALNEEASRLIEKFSIKTPSLTTRGGTLSGGNIQKILLARELAFDPKVVVFNKPTYGLDFKTVALVRGLLKEFVSQGGTVLLISTDLDELTELCDRISIISRGKIVGTVDNNSTKIAEEIGAFMVGDSQ